MLKIKDNIDLKILLKFGFAHDNGCTPRYTKWFQTDNEENPESKHQIIIYDQTREIMIVIQNSEYSYHTDNDEWNGLEDTLYELIDNGLVERKAR